MFKGFLMKKLIYGLFLTFVATFAFGQFYANWPDTNETPSTAYIIAGIIFLSSVTLLFIGYRQENCKKIEDYHFRAPSQDLKDN